MTWNTKFDQLPTQVIEGLCKPTPKSSYSHASGASWKKFKTVIDSVAKWDIESEPDFPAITEQIKKFTDQIKNQIKFNSIGREDQNEILVTADIFPHFNVILNDDEQLKFSSKKQGYQSSRYHLKGKDDLSIIEKVSKIK